MELAAKGMSWFHIPVHMMTHSRFLRRFFGRPCVRVYMHIWKHLPHSVTSSRVGLAYGSHLQWLIQMQSTRNQHTGTFFFRNRPELELLTRLLNIEAPTLSLTILGCSKGAEVYSYLYAIRNSRPDLRVSLHALDIDPDVLAFAKRGVYSLVSRRPPANSSSNSLSEEETLTLNTFGDQRTSLFERMASDEIEAMFDCEGRKATVKLQFREGIIWHVGDAGDPKLMDILGLQDVVVANRFLCHMTPMKSETCLRNLARLVKPGGYLLVSGIDLNVRSKVAQELRWRPVTEFIGEIHEGDASLRQDWPLEYWGLEPFDRRRGDWETRYASVFQIGVESPKNAFDEILHRNVTEVALGS
jgi:chemotaxis methyl-accepting protein methylase